MQATSGDRGLVSATFLAARLGDVGALDRLTDKEPALLTSRGDYLSRWGFTPLHAAACEGMLCAASVLLEKGATVDDKCERYGRTPLHWACEEGHRRVVKLLLAHGASLEAIDSVDGATALMLAAQGGHVAVVKSLLRHYARRSSSDQALREWVNRVDRYGRSALWLACGEGHADLAWALVARGGADAGRADGRGRRPLHVALARGRQECVHMLQWLSQEGDRAWTLHKARRLHELTRGPPSPSPSPSRSPPLSSSDDKTTRLPLPRPLPVVRESDSDSSPSAPSFSSSSSPRDPPTPRPYPYLSPTRRTLPTLSLTAPSSLCTQCRREGVRGMGQVLKTWMRQSIQRFKSKASSAVGAVRGHWMLQAWPEFWDGESVLEGDMVRWGEGRKDKAKPKSMWEQQPSKRSRVSEQETHEVLSFVVTQLPTELYDELLAGMGGWA